jgi:hypothetical protein
VKNAFVTGAADLWDNVMRDLLARSWNACDLLLILERLRFARGAAW